MSSQVIIIIIVILLFAGFIGYQVMRGRKQREAWEELARRFGLTFTPGVIIFDGPTVNGVYHGRQVSMENVQRGGSKNKSTYTLIHFEVNNPVGLSLSLRENNLINRTASVFGGHKIELGDTDFDQRFILKGHPEPALVELLSSISLRQALLRGPALHVDLERQSLNYERSGLETDSTRLELLFNLLNSLADGIDRPGVQSIRE